MDSGELREPWLPSGAGERFGFRVSNCDEGIVGEVKQFRVSSLSAGLP